ncbi:MAG: hypothetical protein ACL7BU_10275 [Candidatus Phlomobacter fragariae]
MKTFYAVFESTSQHLANAEVDTNENEQLVKLYFYAIEPNEGFKISAGIDIPGVGDFNTREWVRLPKMGRK